MKKESENAELSWWKKATHKDANIFIKIARSTLLLIAAYSAYTTILPHVLSGRSITDNEEVILQEMGYKSSIDANKVLFHTSDFADSYLEVMQSSFSVNGNVILIHSSEYKDDYSKESNITKGFWEHEMGHIWQKQNCVLFTEIESIKNMYNVLVKKEDASNLYNYTLDDKKDLLDYGVEQQPTIIMEFHQLTHYNQKPYAVNNQTIGDLSQAETEELERKYRAVLKNFLKDPSYANGKCLGI